YWRMYGPTSGVASLLAARTVAANGPRTSVMRSLSRPAVGCASPKGGFTGSRSPGRSPARRGIVSRPRGRWLPGVPLDDCIPTPCAVIAAMDTRFGCQLGLDPWRDRPIERHGTDTGELGVRFVFRRQGDRAARRGLGNSLRTQKADEQRHLQQREAD